MRKFTIFVTLALTIAVFSFGNAVGADSLVTTPTPATAQSTSTTAAAPRAASASASASGTSAPASDTSELALDETPIRLKIGVYVVIAILVFAAILLPEYFRRKKIAAATAEKDGTPWH
ncbi:MAG TPA: hypothetical protein VK737_11310 [Opitutales bacterium]|jgi:hypothetical protein|nr:hypothetical protein [Opitutales bacterium]